MTIEGPDRLIPIVNLKSSIVNGCLDCEEIFHDSLTIPDRDPSIGIRLTQRRILMDGSERFNDEYDGKICELSGSDDQSDLELIKRLAKNSLYVCSTCGRSAANEENLCSPEAL
jgi:hypothetical protein